MSSVGWFKYFENIPVYLTFSNLEICIMNIHIDLQPYFFVTVNIFRMHKQFSIKSICCLPCQLSAKSLHAL